MMVSYGHHPTGLAVHDGLLYFADGSLETINAINTKEPHSVPVVLKRNVEGVLPLKIYYERHLQSRCCIFAQGPVQYPFVPPPLPLCSSIFKQVKGAVLICDRL